MFYQGDKVMAIDTYQMPDGRKLLTIGKRYQIDIVHYKDLSFSITDDYGGEIVISFGEAKDIFDINNITE
jgi:predicted transcriptional regulator